MGHSQKDLAYAWPPIEYGLTTRDFARENRVHEIEVLARPYSQNPFLMKVPGWCRRSDSNRHEE